MAAGYLLCAVGFALNAFAHTIPALVLCMLVFTLGEMITMPTARPTGGPCAAADAWTLHGRVRTDVGDGADYWASGRNEIIRGGTDGLLDGLRDGGISRGGSYLATITPRPC